MSALMDWICQRSNFWLLMGAAIVLTGLIGLGFELGRAPLLVQLARQTADHATEKRQQAEQALATLQAAKTHGDALSAALLQQQTQIDQLKTEKRDAIKQATTGQPCLRGPALRLLNGAPGLHVTGLPEPASGPVAAGEPIGTDTDIALWIVDAGAAFEVCRARLDALIDWHTPNPSPVKP